MSRKDVREVVRLLETTKRGVLALGGLGRLSIPSAFRRRTQIDRPRRGDRDRIGLPKRERRPEFDEVREQVVGRNFYRYVRRMSDGPNRLPVDENRQCGEVWGSRRAAPFRKLEPEL
jgi:hypothetical protein